jgi:hypothetical protein
MSRLAHILVGEPVSKLINPGQVFAGICAALARCHPTAYLTGSALPAKDHV